MCIKNRALMNKGFWDSLNYLMSLKTVPTNDKLSLVKIRKALLQHHEDLIEALKDNDKKEEVEVLLKEDYTFKLKKIDFRAVESELAPNDIYNLEFIFKELNDE